MLRLTLALVGLFVHAQLALADCSTTIDMKNDTPAIMQTKLDCLAHENADLRATAAKTAEHPYMKSNIVQANNIQEVLRLKLNTVAWITSHHGTATASDINAYYVVGYVGHYSIGASCNDATGLCFVTAAGPEEQDIVDAVHAIHP